MNQRKSVFGTDETREKLKSLLACNKEVRALSAFFTLPAFNWMHGAAPDIQCVLVIRGRPADFRSGASSIEALQEALSAGWTTYIHSALHAKIYLFENCVILGSGNLTANGMNLLSAGNVELNIQTVRTSEIDEIVNSIVNSATLLTPVNLGEMSKYISATPAKNYEDEWWPEKIIPEKKRLLYCSDFPSEKFGNDTSNLVRPWSTISQTLSGGKNCEAHSALASSEAYKWVEGLILLKGQACRFGELTAKLHDSLRDGPAPYRSSVKSLLANLLSFIEECDGIGLQISRPGHSQLVSISEPEKGTN